LINQLIDEFASIMDYQNNQNLQL